MSILIADNIQKVYRDAGDERAVLRGLSMEVRRGEVVAVQGPSGAGKTTLLNILSGLDQPTHGEVVLCGQRLSTLTHRRPQFINRHIGFVFQFFHLLGDLTAFENMMVAARLHAVLTQAEADQRAHILLEEMGLTQRKDAFPAQLSGGEQQRFAIARALMNEPDVLFCDEPTGNLDSQTGEQVMHFLVDLTRRLHKTVLIVTHDDKIARMAETVYQLKDGQWVKAAKSER